jgi:NAD(P)-dependent dehydrogenase (short-subunit alcohol dehydrogenase family)
MHRLEGKVAMVAGGAGGIGTATCRRLASEGAKLCIGDIDQEGVAAIVKEIVDGGGEALAASLDLGDEASIKAAFAAARRLFGSIDFLHCNGAMTGPMQLKDLNALEIDVAVWDISLRINLTGFLLCTKEALPDMVAKKSGAIVYISSGASYVPEDIRVAYGVSKAGVNHLMRHVAHVWGKQGIRANVIAPGLVMSPASRRLPADLLDRLLANCRSTRHGEPEDIAAMVAMLFSDDGAFINGQTIAVDGGLTLRQ